MTALRWAAAARLADADDRARGASERGLAEQIRMHAGRLVRAAALTAGGGIAVYEMVDDSPLARVVNAGGYLALDWRLLIFSLLIAGTTTGLLIVELMRERRRRRVSGGGQERPGPALFDRSGRLLLLSRLTTGALLVASVTGLIVVSATNAPFSLGPMQLLPGAGRLIASLLLSLGGLSALRNTHLMSRLIGILRRRR